MERFRYNVHIKSDGRCARCSRSEEGGAHSGAHREPTGDIVQYLVVVHLSFPNFAELMERGRIHCDGLSNAVHQKAAELILSERDRQRELWVKPGAAGYLDILKALSELYGTNETTQLDALAKVAVFSLHKTRESLPR